MLVPIADRRLITMIDMSIPYVSIGDTTTQVLGVSRDGSSVVCMVDETLSCAESYAETLERVATLISMASGKRHYSVSAYSLVVGYSSGFCAHGAELLLVENLGYDIKIEEIKRPSVGPALIEHIAAPYKHSRNKMLFIPAFARSATVDSRVCLGIADDSALGDTAHLRMRSIVTPRCKVAPVEVNALTDTFRIMRVSSSGTLIEVLVINANNVITVASRLINVLSMLTGDTFNVHAVRAYMLIHVWVQNTAATKFMISDGTLDNIEVVNMPGKLSITPIHEYPNNLVYASTNIMAAAGPGSVLLLDISQSADTMQHWSS